jgi:CRP-like cAMP-binding protein
MASLEASKEIKALLTGVGRTMRANRGTFLFRRGDPVTGVFLIQSGAVKLGLEQEMTAFPSRRITDGSVLGLPATLSDMPYSLSAEVVDDAELLFVPRKPLMDLLRNRADLCLQIIELLTEELTQTRGALEQARNLRH